MTATCACGQPSPNATICGTCLRQVQLALFTAAFIAPDLATAVARLARFADRNGRTRGHVLPYDQRAADAAHHLHRVLSEWVTELAQDDRPIDSISAMAVWLLRATNAIRRHPDAAQAVEDITQAVHRAQRAIDRPPETLFLGACDNCGTGLYVKPGASLAHCPCGTTYDVQQRRDTLLAEAQDVLATATEISRALTGLGKPITQSAIRGYVHRGSLAAHGFDQDRRPLYRVGDVVDVITRDNGSPRGRATAPGTRPA